MNPHLTTVEVIANGGAAVAVVVVVYHFLKHLAVRDAQLVEGQTARAREREAERRDRKEEREAYLHQMGMLAEAVSKALGKLEQLGPIACPVLNRKDVSK